MGGLRLVRSGDGGFGRGVVALAVVLVIALVGVDPAAGAARQVHGDGDRPAIARCKDDSLSTNTDFKTTCKTRGGIRRWAAPYGKCNDGTVIKLSRRASCRPHEGFKVLLAQDFVPKARKGHIAECKDGTFSGDKRLSKTCGNRGGVQHWLKAYGSCRDGRAIRMSTKATCADHGGFDGLLASEQVPAQFGDNVALCNDGGYSDNLDFRATCSGGDGIDVWLATYGQCAGGAVIKMRHDSECNTGEFDHLLPGDFQPIDAGYVALCMNGVYSANTDFHSTCDTSGGVRTWLATYGSCTDKAVFRVGRDGSCVGHGGFRSLLPRGYVPKTPVLAPLLSTPTAPPATAPPPTAPPTTAPYVPPPTEPPVAEPQGGGCHPSYTPCVPFDSDVDCAGGRGNGPSYTGRVEVHGYDEYDLDRDGDGIGCEDS